MQTAQVTEWGQSPKLTILAKPSPPQDDSVVQIKVLATGIHHLVKGRGSGKHYSSGSLPHTPGIDGTGINLANNQLVYFSLLPLGPSPGSFAEVVNVKTSNVYPLPEGVDPIAAAGLVNAVAGGYMALKYRAELREGWKLLIMGAASASGRVAVRIAKQMGAVKVYGAARKEGELNNVEGLDERVVLNTEDPPKTDFSKVSDATVVVDYLWGPWPEVYLKATSGVKTPLQWLSVGPLAGEGALVPSSMIRSRDVTFRGGGLGAWDPMLLAPEMKPMLDVLKGMTVDDNIVQKVPFEEVEKGWDLKGARVVFTMEK